MNDLVEFFRARLDEDERLAQAGRVEGDLFIDFKPANGEEKHPGEAALLAHIGNWDPIRVLAEVEAKRRIVDLYSKVARYDDVDASYEQACLGLGEAVRLLATACAEHPDYDPMWAAAEVSE